MTLTQGHIAKVNIFSYSKAEHGCIYFLLFILMHTLKLCSHVSCICLQTNPNLQLNRLRIYVLRKQIMKRHSTAIK